MFHVFPFQKITSVYQQIQLFGYPLEKKKNGKKIYPLEKEKNEIKINKNGHGENDHYT